jgi:hypothetical protein
MLQTREPIHGTMARNWGEVLADLGNLVRGQMRRGAGIEEAARRAQLRMEQCRLALVYGSAAPQLKLRAMVEDWSHHRIAEELDSIMGDWTLAAPQPTAVAPAASNPSGPGISRAR